MKKDQLTIFETDHFVVTQAGDYAIPGYIIILSKAPFAQIADFPAEQLGELLKCIATADNLVQELVQPERIYILKFGEAVPTVHFHVFPRTREIAKAYLAQVIDEEPYSGARIMDWIWNNHKSIGYTMEQILDFVHAARKSL